MLCQFPFFFLPLLSHRSTPTKKSFCDTWQHVLDFLLTLVGRVVLSVDAAIHVFSIMHCMGCSRKEVVIIRCLVQVNRS